MKIWSTNIPNYRLIILTCNYSYKRVARPFFLFLLAFCFSSKVNAQQNIKAVSFKLHTNKVLVAGQAFNSFIIKITNNSNVSQTATLKVVVDKELQLVSLNQKAIQLSAKDSIFVPVKIYNGANLSAGNHLATITLENANGILQESNITFVVKGKRNAHLFVIQPSIALIGNEDSISIPVQVTNSGNGSTPITIVANLPLEIQTQNFHKAISFNLAAFKDTLITLRKRIPNNLSSQASFQINIYGFYEKGDLFDQSSVMVQTLQDTRKRPNDPLPDYFNGLPDRIMLTVQNAFTNNAYYRLNGGSGIYLPAGRINYNIDANISQADFSNPYLRNTYLSYETHKMGLTVGNINRSFDLNIYGRGASFYLFDTAHKNYYETGFIDNASNLLQAPNSIYASGRTAWAELKHTRKDYSFQSVAVYQKDPLLGVNNALFNNNITWTTKNHFQFSTSLNSSNASNIINPSLQKSGWLAEFDAFGNLGKWNINSMNAYSSPYYAGIQKGVKKLLERISLQEGRLNYWASINYNNNKPQYVSSQFNYQSEYGNTNIALGLSGSFKKFSLSVSPNYSVNKTTFYLGSDLLNAEISAWRLTTQMGYANSPAGFYFNINSDEGFGKNHLTGKSELQLKVNSTLSYKFITISGNIQRGSFYAGDALNSYLMNLPTYHSININPILQHSFLHNKLNISAGLSYAKMNNIASTSYNTNFDYNISKMGSIGLNIARYQYDFGEEATNTIQINYTQKLPGLRIGEKKSTLTVLFFKDLNNNGIFDEQDSLAINQEVNINDAAFITNKKGEVIYRNLPKGNYEISILRKGRWYAENQTIPVLGKKVFEKIPLHKTGTVNGSLIYSFSEYSYDVKKQKAEIRIDAIDEKGKKHTAVTDNYGHFAFFLPIGKYTIYLHQDDLPDEVECPNNGQVITISAQKNTAEINFILKVKERHIETKKFFSSSLTKLDPGPESNSELKPGLQKPKPNLK